MRRDYSSVRSAWSQNVSKTIVLPQLYHPLWGAISIDHQRSPSLGSPSEWDLLGSDAILVTVKGEKILLGERFRKAKYRKFDDITIRWRSSITGEILEPHSLNCQYFVYAHIDEDHSSILKWWICHPSKLLEAMRSGKLKGEEFPNRGEGGSVLMAFKTSDLERQGCLYKSGFGKYAPVLPPSGTTERVLDTGDGTQQGTLW